MSSDQDVLRIPSELGLRLSMVFMFDRLVFVEGPSDEAVLREFARTLDIDLAKANVAFVHLGGIRNFGNYAAQGTLDLLSRRQVKMWFVADRDERDDAEITGMIGRLGESARLAVLERRELENYLLGPRAVAQFFRLKQVAGNVAGPVPTESAVLEALQRAARGLRDAVVRLHLERRMLKPVILQSRQVEGTAVERLDRAISDLEERKRSFEGTRAEIEGGMAENWERDALRLAPGALVLDAAAREFGVRFQKDNGDSARLAKEIDGFEIAEEVRTLLKDIVAG